jgi:hypothetical protein
MRLILASLLLLAAACAAPSLYATPEKTVTAFLEASKAGDRKKMIEATVESERAEAVSNDVKPTPQLEFTIGTAKINGDSAEVPVNIRLDGDKVDVILVTRKEQGVWHISKKESHAAGEEPAKTPEDVNEKSE